MVTSPLNVRWFGATGNGTTDDTAAVQAALTAASSAGGAEVFFPRGVYLVGGLVPHSNTTLVGEGYGSVLKQKAGTNHVVNTNPSDGGTSDVAANKRGITIRALKFLGTVAADGFSEHVHLLFLSAVSDVLVERCAFVGFRGDGVYIGSGDSGGAERHNEAITIRKCLFDGVNNENRQGVSVIDCTNLLIEDCRFTNCTRSNMPGAIDIEPDNFAFARVRDIKILNNKFVGVGGNVGVIALYLPRGQVNLTTPMRGLTIEGNHILGCSNAVGIQVVQSQSAVAATIPNAITIRNNDISSGPSAGIIALGVKGVRIIDNKLSDLAHVPIALGGSTRDVFGVLVEGNQMVRCDTTGFGGMQVSWSSHVAIRKNLFEALGIPNGSFGYAIDFAPAATTSYVSITENVIIPGGRTTWAIQVEAGHTLMSATNRFRDNELGGLGNAFVHTAPGSVLQAQANVDPPSVANGGSYLSAAITVTGAVVGDLVDVAAGDLQGLSLSAYVSAADTVRFTLGNQTGAAVNLPSATWYVRVTKR